MNGTVQRERATGRRGKKLVTNMGIKNAPFNSEGAKNMERDKGLGPSTFSLAITGFSYFDFFHSLKNCLNHFKNSNLEDFLT